MQLRVRSLSIFPESVDGNWAEQTFPFSQNLVRGAKPHIHPFSFSVNQIKINFLNKPIKFEWRSLPTIVHQFGSKVIELNDCLFAIII